MATVVTKNVMVQNQDGCHRVVDMYSHGIILSHMVI